MAYDDDIVDETVLNPADAHLARMARWVGLLSGLVFFGFALSVVIETGGI